MEMDLSSKISMYRQKAVEKTITLEDMIEAVKLLRAGRVSAAVASEGSRKKAAAKVVPTVNGDDLLNEMLS